MTPPLNRRDFMAQTAVSATAALAATTITTTSASARGPESIVASQEPNRQGHPGQVRNPGFTGRNGHRQRR